MLSRELIQKSKIILCSRWNSKDVPTRFLSPVSQSNTNLGTVIRRLFR